MTVGAMSERMGKKEWVLVDTHDTKGSTLLAASLTHDGGFAEGFWGSEECEFERRYLAHHYCRCLLARSSSIRIRGQFRNWSER